VHTPDSSDETVTALFRHYSQLAGDGRRVLMLARSNLDVDELNTLARQHAIDTGAVRGEPLLNAGGRDWRVGDRLRVTRNDRRISAGADHLRNGDTLTVTGRSDTGLTVQRLDGSDRAELPVGYVGEHTRYGWASTIASAQGATVDDALLLARPCLDRSNLYVGLTRGRDSNHLYLAPEPDPEIAPRGAAGRRVDAADRIRQMLQTSDDGAAAHTRLPERTESPAATNWPRRPGREQLLRPAARTPRRRGLGLDPRHIGSAYPERGYGRDFGR
jgi:ATP-dependent exoDNAse (exonuclease V) alpha subunit